jgi:hypothetical protein
VVDPSAAVVPDATVALIGLEAGTQRVEIVPVKTSPEGVAVLEGVAPGRYSIRATFPGFDIGLLRDVRVRTGTSRHVIVLPLPRLEASVTVQTGQAGAADRRQTEFGLKLAESQIQALSDDPQELARQIAELGGPDAIIRVDSFEGQQLPPKAQIKSIHVVRDQFAAEAAQAGSTFVDIITQPGIGPIRGSTTFSVRSDGLTGKSRFTPTRGPEDFSNFAGNVGGTLVKEKTSFSANFNRNSTTTSPILNVALPDGTTRAETLSIRQPSTSSSLNVLFDHAITRDQTLRFGFQANENEQENIGIGAYDLPERAWSQRQTNRGFRVQEAGPLGRRSFINTRFSLSWLTIDSFSATEAPTVIVQEAFSSGGAQQGLNIRAKQFTLASDFDHVRGIHSWRAGFQFDGFFFRSDSVFNQLGTYFFSSLDDYRAGRPAVFTQSIGRPKFGYHNLQAGIYIQDDIRVRRGLTFSPGVRYSAQKDIDDRLAFEPRFGMTWAPSASGRTTLRASVGIFHGFLPPPAWEQALRLDGERQKELVIIFPTYPDANIGAGVIPPTNKYAIGDFRLNRNLRYSAGIDQALTPQMRVNVLYNWIHQQQQPRGLNLNAPVNGVRPDPNFANIIELVTDSEIRRHELSVNATFALAAPSPTLQLARFNWKRMNINASYSRIKAQNNSGGPWVVPPTGNIADDWGPGPGDTPYRVQFMITSTQLRNLQVNATYMAFAGFPYNWTTGFDDNRDGFLNDRPDGVGLRTLRGAGQQQLNLRFAYSLNVGASGSPIPGQPGRYRLQLFTNVNNITNHQNLGGYSGVEASPFFRRPTLASNLRRVDVGMTVNF